MALTSEDVVKHFSYIMAEKVKKDALDKKNLKLTVTKASNFIDFACAVTLTNTNSIEQARNQLFSHVTKICAMTKEGHPFGKLMSRLLGLTPNERPSDSAVDYFVAQRHHFIEKIEGGVANQ